MVKRSWVGLGWALLCLSFCWSGGDIAGVAAAAGRETFSYIRQRTASRITNSQFRVRALPT